MNINDSSAIILIIGALAVIAFIIHGLWFSGRSVNRKLSRNNKEDRELEQSASIGKVRIVTAELPSEEQAGERGLTEGFKFQDTSVGTLPKEGEAVAPAPVPGLETPPPETLEINLFAPQDRPFRGEDIEDVCKQYGFIRSPRDLFLVYENAESRDKVVFRICSLKEPFAFPKSLDGYTTHALALYMKLPARGQAFPYFRAMRMAADIFQERLGGHFEDNDKLPLSDEELDRIAEILKRYDNAPEH
ncbi:MAG: hypothetical protein IJ228_00320 [Succinivibrio sp.]|nr:hypothetical protein [Succinivibrio sp.]